MNVEKRMEMERKVVRKLVRVMKAHGWDADLVDDGGDYGDEVKTSSEKDVMEAVFAVDEARIRFIKGEAKHWVVIVLGNDGYDCIADYGYTEGDPDGFVAIMEKEVDPYCDKLAEEA